MIEKRQEAYRHLLFWAMLWFRVIGGEIRLTFSLNPMKWYTWFRKHYSLQAVEEVANWLHNLAGAAISAPLELDEAFEDWFWKEHVRLCKRFPLAKLEFFREEFDDYLQGRR